MLKKAVSLLICFCFIFEQTGFAQMAPSLGMPAYLNNLPPLADRFRPLQMRGLTFDPLQGQVGLYLDNGDEKNAKGEAADADSQALAEYFQIGLRLPNSAFWVNLRPDSPQKIIDADLEKTDLGRVMLEADLQLKKDISLLTSPDTAEGRQYWNKLYEKIDALYGPEEDVEIPTMARPWIVPGEIIIGEAPDGAYIYKATLNVMLEQDYLKDQQQVFSDSRVKELNDYSAQLIRQTLIPKLVKSVNASRKYAALRQVYYSLILAQWFKQRHRGTQQFDSRELSGLTSRDDWLKQSYFDAYRKSFAEGEYHKEEQVNSPYGIYVRQYVSGGMVLGFAQGLAGGLKHLVVIPINQVRRLPDRIVMRIPQKGEQKVDSSADAESNDREYPHLLRVAGANSVSQMRQNFKQKYFNKIQVINAGRSQEEIGRVLAKIESMITKVQREPEAGLIFRVLYESDLLEYLKYESAQGPIEYLDQIISHWDGVPPANRKPFFRYALKFYEPDIDSGIPIVDSRRMNESSARAANEKADERARQRARSAFENYWQLISVPLKAKSIDFAGERYRLSNFDVMAQEEGEFEGKNPIFKVSGETPDGKSRIPLLVKLVDQSPLRNELIVARLAQELGINHYRIESMPIAGRSDKAWLFIEQIPHELLAYSSGFGRFSYSGEKLLQGQPQDVEARLRQLGMILALEYILGAKDTDMKHFLLGNDGRDIFRIDWEYLFDFQNKVFPQLSGVLEGEEKLFLEKLFEEGRSRGVSTQELIIQGMRQTFAGAREQQDLIMELLKERLGPESFDTISGYVQEAIENPAVLEDRLEKIANKDGGERYEGSDLEALKAVTMVNLQRAIEARGKDAVAGLLIFDSATAEPVFGAVFGHFDDPRNNFVKLLVNGRDRSVPGIMSAVYQRDGRYFLRGVRSLSPSDPRYDHEILVEVETLTQKPVLDEFHNGSYTVQIYNARLERIKNLVKAQRDGGTEELKQAVAALNNAGIYSIFIKTEGSWQLLADIYSRFSANGIQPFDSDKMFRSPAEGEKIYRSAVQPVFLSHEGRGDMIPSLDTVFITVAENEAEFGIQQIGFAVKPEAADAIVAIEEDKDQSRPAGALEEALAVLFDAALKHMSRDGGIASLTLQKLPQGMFWEVRDEDGREWARIYKSRYNDRTDDTVMILNVSERVPLTDRLVRDLVVLGAYHVDQRSADWVLNREWDLQSLSDRYTIIINGEYYYFDNGNFVREKVSDLPILSEKSYAWRNGAVNRLLNGEEIPLSRDLIGKGKDVRYYDVMQNIIDRYEAFVVSRQVEHKDEDAKNVFRQATLDEYSRSWKLDGGEIEKFIADVGTIQVKARTTEWQELERIDRTLPGADGSLTHKTRGDVAQINDDDLLPRLLELAPQVLKAKVEEYGNNQEPRWSKEDKALAVSSVRLEPESDKPRFDGSMTFRLVRGEGAKSRNTQDGGALNELGGIDFRALPLTTQPGAMPMTPAVDMQMLRNLAQSSKITDVEEEWFDIQKELAREVMPYQRLKEYVAVCCLQDKQDKLNIISNFISDVLRLEEENALATAPELKELLVLVESLSIARSEIANRGRPDTGLSA